MKFCRLLNKQFVFGAFPDRFDFVDLKGGFSYEKNLSAKEITEKKSTRFSQKNGNGKRS